MPFADAHLLRWHSDRHRREFGFPDETAYLAAAEAFMAGAAAEPTKECFRANGDRLRFNRHLNWFGVAQPDGTLRTFYQPKERNIASGFFKYQCRRQTDDL